jgi:hypothetical protein
MGTRIVFNGREYGSPEEMPPDVRKAFQAVEDLMRAARGGSLGAADGNVRQEFKFEIRTTSGDGGTEVRTYSIPEEIPAEARKLLEDMRSAAGVGGERTGSGFHVNLGGLLDVKVDGPKVIEVRRETVSGSPQLPAGPAGLPGELREDRGREARFVRNERDGRDGGGLSADRILLLALAVLAGLALVLGLAWLIVRAR